MQKTLSFLVVNMLLGWMYCIEPLSAQTVSAPVIDTPLTSSHTYFYNGEIIVPYASGHVSVTNNASVKILSTTDVDLLSGFTASVDSGCGEFVAGISACDSFIVDATIINPICFGSSDGQISLEVSGGQAPYNYLFKDSLTHTSLGNQNYLWNCKAGLYTVLISDMGSCSSEYHFQINEPTSITSQLSIVKPNCNSMNGAISASVSGGVSPYKYEWTLLDDSSHGVLSQEAQLNNIQSGNYGLIIIDSIGCILYNTVLVGDSNGPEINLTRIRNSSCHGSIDGEIEISVSSGTAPFTFFWSGRQETDSIISNLPAGLYECLVTDQAGCKASYNFTIQEPSGISIVLSTIPSSCSGSTGVAEAIVTGGTPPYQYNWGALGSDSSICTKIPSGIDSVYVRDSMGCAVNQTFVISDSSTNNFTVVPGIAHEISCFGGSDGSLQAIITGGIPPYETKWYAEIGDSVLSTTMTLSNVGIGRYRVHVKDSLGCSINREISIYSPDPIELSIYAINPSSDTLGDGYCTILAEGGTFPEFTYLWSTGSTSAEISGLLPGTYTVTVTDDNGCTGTAERSIHVNHQDCYECNYNTYAVCGGSPVTVPCAPNCTYIYKDIVSDFGANGQDGLSDQCAFEAAADFFRNALGPCGTYGLCGGHGVLHIPAGEFIVGRQQSTHGKFAEGSSVLCFSGIQDLTISGEVQGGRPVSKIKYEDCMLYGLFDPVTGERHLGPLPCWYSIPVTPGLDEQHDIIVNCYQCGWTQVNQSRMAFPGTMFQFVDCQNISISNLDLNGNSDNAILGGNFCDGIQLAYDGFFLSRCTNVEINNCMAHHFGRDGIMITDITCHPVIPPVISPRNMGIRIFNSKFYYNGRQGFSWVGGSGVTAINSEFNLTGQATISSQPGAGMDIEYENGGIISNGQFINCNFIHNKNNGVIDDASDVGAALVNYNHSFTYCIFKGSRYGNALWPNTRRMSFNNSNFYGVILKGYDSPVGTPSPSNHNNLYFNQSSFNEEDQYYSYSITNSDQCVNGCDQNPDYRYNYMINFVKVGRGTFNQCQLITNKYMKWGIGGGGGDYYVPPPNENRDDWNYLTFDNSTFTNHGFNICGDCNNTSLSEFGSLWGNGDWPHVRLLHSTIFNFVANITGGACPNGTACSSCGNLNADNYWFHWNQYCGDCNGLWPGMTYNLTATDLACQHIYDDSYYLTAPEIFMSCDPCQESCCEGINAPITYPTPCGSNLKNRGPSARNVISTDLISPNPIIDYLNIKAQETIESIVIYDIQGMRIYESSNIGQIDFSFKMTEQNPGVYFIVINKKRYYKIIKI